MPRTITIAQDQVTAAEDSGQVIVTLPDNVFSEADVKANFVPLAKHEALQSSVSERITTAKRNARTELAADDDFLAEIADSRAPFFRERFGAETPDRQAVIEAIRRDEVEPLKKQVATIGEENLTLRRSAVRGDVEVALTAAKLLPGAHKLVREYVERRSVYSSDVGGAVVVEDDGETVRQRASEGGFVPMRPEHLLSEMRESGDYDNFFAAADKDGSGFGGTPAAGAGKVQFRSQFRSDKERADYIAKHGSEAYLDLPEKDEST